MLSARNRLTRKADFDRLFASIRPLPHPLITLRAAPNETAVWRAGIVCGKRVGRAVVRNRTKRRLRAALRQALASEPPAWDILVVVRPLAAQATVAEFVSALKDLLRRSGMLAAPAAP